MHKSAPSQRFDLEALGLRLEVLGTHTLGGRAFLAWLRAAPVAKTVRGAMTVEGLHVEETDCVERIRVRNPMDKPVLVPADWVLDGGKQCRVVDRSVIVPALAITDLPVRCVEQRRWGSRGRGEENTFVLAGPATSRSRARFVDTRERCLAERGAYRLDQREVWDHVERELDRSSVRSSTQSYVSVLEATEAPLRAKARRHVARMPEIANGLLILDGDERGWLEIMPGAAELRAVAGALVVGALESDDEREDALGPERAMGAVREELDAVACAPLRRLDAPLQTLGEHLAVRSDHVAGAAVLLEGEIAHLAVRLGRSVG